MEGAWLCRDYVSGGRAGWRPHVSTTRAEAVHFGRRKFPEVTEGNSAGPTVSTHIGELFDEAADYVEVVRRLWDSW